MEETTIRVVIADDHGVVRGGLRGFLNEPDIDVVGEAATGREAIDLVDELQPDVVLLDIRMPDVDGLQALAEIKTTHPTTSVIMLTTYYNPKYLARSVELGAAGYLSKELDPERIPRAVRAAATGETLLDRDLLRAALENTMTSSESPSFELPPMSELTEREIEVLKLIAEGCDNDTVAQKLFISHNTVKTHVRHIFGKLGVSDRTRAALWAVRHGLVKIR